MTFTQAKASGRRAKLPTWEFYQDLNNVDYIMTIAEFESDKYELEAEEVKVWTPKDGELFYCNTGGGNTLEYTAEYDWAVYQRNYNSFETRDEALRVASFQRVQRKLLALAKALNGEWRPVPTETRWTMYYSNTQRVFKFYTIESANSFEITFKSSQLAKTALSQLTQEEKDVLIRGMQ